MTVAGLFPGQGSQQRGMGRDLFARYPALVEQASDAAGTDLRTLCLDDPDGRLGDTRWSQPALFLVNALAFRRAWDEGERYGLLLGHSLGEYNALEAAGALDFADAATLVARRGQLMSAARGGTMAAVVGRPDGPNPDDLGALLAEAGADDLEVANLNSPTQVVVSGEAAAVKRLVAYVRSSKRARAVPLAVSAAFHSRHMEPAAAEFADALRAVRFHEPRVPVIANVTGKPYPPGEIVDGLARQMRSQVRWWDSMLEARRLGATDARQLGPGDVLVPLWKQALAAPLPTAPAPAPRPPVASPARQPEAPAAERAAPAAGDAISRRGHGFCAAHGVREPYVAGAMYRGIASVDLVIRMARAGLLAVLGTSGLDLTEVEEALVAVGRAVAPGTPFGANLMSRPDHPAEEQRLVELYLRHGVGLIEAAAYTQVSAPLVEFRFRGAAVEGARARAPRQVIAKVSRREVAEQFLRPPSERLLRELQESGRLDAAEVAAARRLPVSADVCVESDSGGHTDGGVALAVLPSLVRLRDEVAGGAGLDEIPRVGAAGGLGAPEAVAAAFVLGAEFVVTGSVNQCTPEAGTSPAVKDLLAQLSIGDTAYAPAGDLFELGARVQVVRKGTLFPARANFLYQCYRANPDVESLEPRTRGTVERYLGRSVDDAWEVARDHLAATRPEELTRIRNDGRARMARIFKTYFARTVELALTGDPAERANYQIHSGPAIGAVNAYLHGTALEDWRSRHVDELAGRLLADARNVMAAQI